MPLVTISDSSYDFEVGWKKFGVFEDEKCGGGKGLKGGQELVQVARDLYDLDLDRGTRGPRQLSIATDITQC